MSDKTYPKNQWPELYLDWVNNFLTVERFAEYYGVTVEHANEILNAGRDSDNFTKDPNIRYSIVKLHNGMYRPQKEYGDRAMYPAFNTLRDAIIFMEHLDGDFVAGIVGNVQIVEESPEKRLCRICGEFMPLEDFEMSEDVCKWCDVTLRDKEKK